MVSTRSVSSSLRKPLSQTFHSVKAQRAGVTQPASPLVGNKDASTNGKAAPTKRRRSPSDSTADGKAQARKKVIKKDGVRQSTTAPTPPAPSPVLPDEEIALCTTIAMPTLSFDLEAGKEHLRKADSRFGPLLERLPLRVFETLQPHGPEAVSDVKQLDLFKTLVTSILGQQVTWLAARAILYRFLRIFFPELPEKPDFAQRPRDSLPFPNPRMVCSATPQQLRDAGLSGQKSSYVRDIAERFSDGRLDVRKIVAMNNEDDLVKHLCQIKGVGVWTAQMMEIFALRRPDVLPVGDLGVQRGMVLLWASGPQGPTISSAKAKPALDIAEEKASDSAQAAHTIDETVHESEVRYTGVKTDVSVNDQVSNGLPAPGPLPALPEAAKLTPSQLQARKNGTKTKGNVYLSAFEMEALAETWKPYRSLASVLMWGLVDS